MRGKLFQEIPPIRWSFRFFDIGIKWISPKWIYPADIYPDYLAGMGFDFLTKICEIIFMFLNLRNNTGFQRHELLFKVKTRWTT
jgi:hypothetical protein